MLPNKAFNALQQATQFSSLLPPPLALATRCSTLASLCGSSALQKKHDLPWANINRSSGFIGIFLLRRQAFFVVDSDDPGPYVTPQDRCRKRHRTHGPADNSLIKRLVRLSDRQAVA